jgi:ribosome-binding protein aMBF1 (putative translation factor)
MPRKAQPHVSTDTLDDYIKDRAARDPEFAQVFAREFDRRKIATAIRAARKYRHLTQAQLAQRAKLKQPHVARVESATATPSFETLHSLARALGCDLRLELVPHGS